MGRGLGALLALAFLVAVYACGAPGGSVFGGGEGQLAVILFLGISLVVAGIRGDAGCELMAVSGALLGRHTHLACLIFSPLDRLELKLWDRRRGK